MIYVTTDALFAIVKLLVPSRSKIHARGHCSISKTEVYKTDEVWPDPKRYETVNLGPRKNGFFADFMFGRPDFFADFVAGFFCPHFCGVKKTTARLLI